MLVGANLDNFFSLSRLILEKMPDLANINGNTQLNLNSRINKKDIFSVHKVQILHGT